MELKINGQNVQVDLDPDKPLLWALREDLKLTGSKFGCGISLCGACTVHVDGVATRSCVTPVGELLGKEIVTIEGLSRGENLSPVQRAWLKVGVPQCGYCQSGQIMSAAALLKNVPNPTDEEIDRAMAGNLCRCGTYSKIRQAIKIAASELKA